ncbi:MAG: hypothetical protein AABX91_02155 [Nanoarchaeota archaeon]
MTDGYNASEIKVLEGLEGVRKRFDVIELINPFIPKSMLYKIGGKNE